MFYFKTLPEHSLVKVREEEPLSRHPSHTVLTPTSPSAKVTLWSKLIKTLCFSFNAKSRLRKIQLYIILLISLLAVNTALWSQYYNPRFHQIWRRSRGGYGRGM